MKKSKLAPIVLFVYNRPNETKNTIEALKKNELAHDSDLYIYSDGAKNKEQLENIKLVRKIINNIKGFKNVEIIESKGNNGLANSIIKGVTEILDKYGKIIVMEDDLICAEDYLEYMNEALEMYETNNLIWSISGYTAPIKIPENYKKDIYLTPRSSSWGWATWKNRWERVDWRVSDFEELKKDKKKIVDLNLGGNDMFKMLELQMLGKIDSWAIRWCYSQYIEKMYTVYPSKSKIINDGIKAGGTHATSEDSRWTVKLSKDKIILDSAIKTNTEILKIFKEYQNLDWIGKIGYFSKKNNFYKIFKRYKKYLRK